MKKENSELNMLIVNSLKLFDEQNKKYKKYINNNNINFDRDNSIITFNDFNKIFSYQTLGIYDKTTNVWIWGWMYPESTSNEIILVKKILDYGLKQNNDTKERILSVGTNFLKTQLTNSRFIINKHFQLEINLAICSYLLKEQIKFIYKKPFLKNKNIILYLMISEKI
tara:strand:- start:63 stop:566 length:504 start_codon:yes stop_codon:yes gene_type:complete